jgi:hypothetical protein
MVGKRTETHKLVPSAFELRVLTNNINNVIGISNLLNKVLVKFQSDSPNKKELPWKEAPLTSRLITGAVVTF